MPRPTDLVPARTKSSIDGAWCDGAKVKFAAGNPAAGGTLVEAANCGAVGARRAIDAATNAPPAWHARTAKKRARILRDCFDMILASHEDRAKRATAAQGKPIVASRGEIACGASFVEWLAEEGKRLCGDVIPTPQPDKQLPVFKEPIGASAARAAQR